MTNFVTFPVALGGDGKTYTDDADPETGLDGLGYTVRFIPCLEQAVIMGLSAKDNAEAAANFADQCQTLRNAVSADRQAVANDRTHVNQQRNVVDAAAQEAAQSAASVNASNIVHAPGSGLPNEAGLAYSRDVIGGGANSPLMAEGAFGLGSSLGELLADIDAVSSSGLFAYDPSTTGDVPNTAGSLLRQRRGGRILDLSIFESRTDPAASVRAFNGSWGDWDELIPRRKIVGTVSQSDGNPTGGLFESASSANGTYLKLPGGSLFASHHVKAEFQDSGTLVASWTFPVPFASASAYSASATLMQRNPMNSVEGAGIAKLKLCEVYESAHSGSVFNVHVGAPAGTFAPGDFAWVSFQAIGTY